MITTPVSEVVRKRLRVVGLVQGVGFRPYVHRLATELALDGFVGNDPLGVFIEVEGTAGATDEFMRRLPTHAPAAARVDAVQTRQIATTGGTGFTIAASRPRGVTRTFVSPDLATCDDCLADVFDPSNRRARYPFTNCSNCGPRFTITLGLPYDRSNTTMRSFTLCAACSAEYHDPTDRRFHAQPIACPDCGPRLWLEWGSGSRSVAGTDAALAAAQAALAQGQIVAIKGLGGFHLACDARADAAVAKLRERKRRTGKPFAVMTRDLQAARALARIGPAEAQSLLSVQRPIVLLRRHGRPADDLISALVAPGNPRLGVLLPYTPLHHLLFAPVPGSDAPDTVPRVLVMTSGNLGDEPICFEDEEARGRLRSVADAWLLHDRPIHVPCDDSVLDLDPATGTELPLRRSRGYAPLPVPLPFAVRPTLAVGGELKNTFCLAAGRDGFMSQHIGDMGGLETWRAFGRASQHLTELYGMATPHFAADAHPGYQATRWAENASQRPVAEIHHHHAHIASVMAEHGVPQHDRVIGLAFDGSGYGADGTVWGGEVLVAGYTHCVRGGHLSAVPLPGGDATIRRPYRAALAHLRAAGIEWAEDLHPVRGVSEEERTVMEHRLAGAVGCVLTSSMGRLFDAVSSILGFCQEARYEAEAALCLQWAAEHDVGTGHALAGLPVRGEGLRVRPRPGPPRSGGRPPTRRRPRCHGCRLSRRGGARRRPGRRGSAGEDGHRSGGAERGGLPEHRAARAGSP